MDDNVLKAPKDRTLGQLVVFSFFFPFPAILTFGRTLGVQTGQALALITILLGVGGLLRSKSTGIYLAILGGALVSLTGLAFSSSGTEADLAVRSALALAISLVFLPAGGVLLARYGAGALKTPVALAIIIHGITGAYQYVSFQDGTFPFLGLFSNPSFADLTAASTDYVEYVRRPFGLFPEPSAMAACIAPWCIWLLREAFVDVVKWRRRICFWAVGCGAALVAVSQSSFSLIFFPLLFWVIVRSRGISGRGALLARVATLLLAVASALAGIVYNGRIGQYIDGNESARHQSLVYALSLPLETAHDALLGLGPGQSAAPLQALLGTSGGIYSITLTLWAEAGLVGLIVVGVICACLFRGRLWNLNRVAVICWIAGVTLATGYFALGPVWLFLALAIQPQSACQEAGFSKLRAPDHEITKSRANSDRIDISAPIVSIRARRATARL